jgi:hypothetical protein
MVLSNVTVFIWQLALIACAVAFLTGIGGLIWAWRTRNKARVYVFIFAAAIGLAGTINSTLFFLRLSSP